jgi:membrane-associated phospholipid phosphatase
MAAYESVALAYFVGLSLVAWRAPVPLRRRFIVSGTAVAIAVVVAAVAELGNGVLRAWAPHVYLVAGYWLPAMLAARPVAPTGFERWLVRSDSRVRRRLPAVPEALRPLMEAAYLLCYPLIPAAFAIVWLRGAQADVTRFWVAVLLSGYACYVCLPWLVSRPPRLLERATVSVNPLATVNAFVLGRVSHGLNTFPSGHVAVSCAAAAMLAAIAPAAAAVFGIVAALVAVGAAAGRYHYAVDVLFGLAVAAAGIGIALGMQL